MPDVVGGTRQGEQALTASLVAMAVLDEERHVSVNRQYVDLFGYEDAAELEGTAWRDRFDDDAQLRLEREVLPICLEAGQWRGAVTGRQRDGSSLPLDLSIVELESGEFVVSLRALPPDRRPPPGPVDRRGRLAPRRGEAGTVAHAGTVDRTDRLVFRIVRDLFEMESRCGIEGIVCEGLAAADGFAFAWIAGPEPEGNRLRLRAAAGIDEADVETTVGAACGDAEPGPAVRAIRSGEPVVGQDVPGDPAFEAWRSVVADHDVGSAAVFPIGFRGDVRGCLAVAATRRQAFGRRAREALETLGLAVGFTIEAVANRELLYADTVVELEFEVSARDHVFAGVSDRLDCELTVTGCVASEAGTWSVYVSVASADPAAVRDATMEAATVEAVQVITVGDDGGSLEVVMDGPAVTELAACGAIPTSGRAANGQGRFCIEVPQTCDVRRVRDRLRAAYPDSSLVAQREHERPARTAREVRRSLAERLTDRQREALERAAHAGYFEWPRTSTAGDVADSMAVSETTFHYHLRNGLDTLLGALPDLDGG